MDDSSSAATSPMAPPEWVRKLPDTKATQPDSWPPKSSHYYDWDNWETHEVYSDVNRTGFETGSQPDFSKARSRLDYEYHFKPAQKRQELQDTILYRVVSCNSTEQEPQQQQQQQPWMVFTAGAMGVGKGYVLSTLYKSKLFPLDDYLKIDPDMIKTELPEMSGYLRADPATAATKVHRESTQMADVLLEQALLDKIPSLVDGSLRDVEYYSTLLKRVRGLGYKIGILLVTAHEDTIMERAKARAEKTGRAVPEQLLKESMEQAPKSVEQLAPLADVTYEIANNDGEPLRLVKATRQGKPSLGLSWETFRDTWTEEEESEQDTTGTEENEGKNENKEDEKNDDTKPCSPTKLLKKKHSPCSLQPICSSMASCWEDGAAHDSAMSIWGKAYPNFCARCTLTGDGQCGVCVHGKHLCACTECESTCPVRALLRKASSKLKSSCPLADKNKK